MRTWLATVAAGIVATFVGGLILWSLTKPAVLSAGSLAAALTTASGLEIFYTIDYHGTKSGVIKFTNVNF